MRTDFRFIGKESGLFEFADEGHQFLGGERLLQRIVAGGEVALRQLVRAQERLAREVEDEIEPLLSLVFKTGKIYGADLAAGGDAVAVRGAFREIDLVAVVDRAFGTGADAGVAARADL